jgi:hypothetical protein
MTSRAKQACKTVLEIGSFFVQEWRMTAAKALDLTVPPTPLATADDAA